MESKTLAEHVRAISRQLVTDHPHGLRRDELVSLAAQLDGISAGIGRVERMLARRLTAEAPRTHHAAADYPPGRPVPASGDVVLQAPETSSDGVVLFRPRPRTLAPAGDLGGAA